MFRYQNILLIYPNLSHIFPNHLVVCYLLFIDSFDKNIKLIKSKKI